MDGWMHGWIKLHKPLIRLLRNTKIEKIMFCVILFFSFCSFFFLLLFNFNFILGDEGILI